jgi:hypothetical protein
VTNARNLVSSEVHALSDANDVCLHLCLLLLLLLLLQLLLQIINKRGAEAFEQADEELLRLFCAELEGLLRSKTVEVRQTDSQTDSQTGSLNWLPELTRTQ